MIINMSSYECLSFNGNEWVFFRTKLFCCHVLFLFACVSLQLSCTKSYFQQHTQRAPYVVTDFWSQLFLKPLKNSMCLRRALTMMKTFSTAYSARPFVNEPEPSSSASSFTYPSLRNSAALIRYRIYLNEEKEENETPQQQNTIL